MSRCNTRLRASGTWRYYSITLVTVPEENRDTAELSHGALIALHFEFHRDLTKNYFRSSQTCFISRPKPSRSGKITDSVTPHSRSSIRIFTMFSGSGSIGLPWRVTMPRNFLLNFVG